MRLAQCFRRVSSKLCLTRLKGCICLNLRKLSSGIKHFVIPGFVAPKGFAAFLLVYPGNQDHPILAGFAITHKYKIKEVCKKIRGLSRCLFAPRHCQKHQNISKDKLGIHQLYIYIYMAIFWESRRKSCTSIVHNPLVCTSNDRCADLLQFRVG